MVTAQQPESFVLRYRERGSWYWHNTTPAALREMRTLHRCVREFLPKYVSGSCWMDVARAVLNEHENGYATILLGKYCRIIVKLLKCDGLSLRYHVELIRLLRWYIQITHTRNCSAAQRHTGDKMLVHICSTTYH